MNRMQSRYLGISDKLFEEKIEKAAKILSDCSLCPHRCGADRTRGETGFCRAQAESEAAHWQKHFGEEPPLSGECGAGTIFFSHCTMRCVYCQNYQISHQPDIKFVVTPSDLAGIMISLQEQGAQNIDLVSPTQYVPKIVEAVYLARGRGLEVPLVYNTNGYESAETLALLEGIIDIYLPDLKYSDDEEAEKYSKTPGYWKNASRALENMYAQVGDFLSDEQGRGRRGLIVRHLVLPENISGSFKVFDFLKKKLSLNIGLSVMSQYAPCFQAFRYEKINRKISSAEYAKAVDYVEELGFRNCWIQEPQSSDDFFPDFDRENVFEDQDQNKQ